MHLDVFGVGVGMEVQPSKTSSCHSLGLIDEVIRVSRSRQHVHIYSIYVPHAWDLLLARHRHWYKGPTIQHLIRMTSSWDFADDGPWKILGSPPGVQTWDLSGSR